MRGFVIVVMSPLRPKVINKDKSYKDANDSSLEV